MIRTMKTYSENFVQNWVSANVQNIPGLDNYREEVKRLSAALLTDARKAGIKRAALTRTVGDMDDHMTYAYENVIDPELGLKW